MTARTWKIAGTVIVCIPLAFFLMFAIGEGAGGVGHYLQAFPFAVLLVFGWYRPKITGWIFIALACTFAIVYATTAHNEPFLTIVLVETVIAVPAACTGWCFLRASR